MFGDKDAYLDKFKTCARSRPFGSQILDECFFTKEHSKPLFTKYSISTIHNLYYYYCATEVFKIMKFRNPISLHSLFNLSKRSNKDTLLLAPHQSDTFVSKAGAVWNIVRQRLNILDFSLPIGTLKSQLKIFIQNQQALGDCWEWEESNTLQTKLG